MSSNNARKRRRALFSSALNFVYESLAKFWFSVDAATELYLPFCNVQRQKVQLAPGTRSHSTPPRGWLNQPEIGRGGRKFNCSTVASLRTRTWRPCLIHPTRIPTFRHRFGRVRNDISTRILGEILFGTQRTLQTLISRTKNIIFAFASCLLPTISMAFWLLAKQRCRMSALPREYDRYQWSTILPFSRQSHFLYLSIRTM